jgi:RNA exonuclease 4
VGHGLTHDLDALLLSHPFSLTRDTAKYRPLQRSKGQPRKLSFLAKKYLGVTIQSGEHKPV